MAPVDPADPMAPVGPTPRRGVPDRGPRHAKVASASRPATIHGDVSTPPNIFRAGFGVGQTDFHPMKGPMTTQSLRGMANHGPMHWRGDRNGEGQGTNVQPDGGAFSEDKAF